MNIIEKAKKKTVAGLVGAAYLAGIGTVAIIPKSDVAIDKPAIEVSLPSASEPYRKLTWEGAADVFVVPLAGDSAYKIVFPDDVICVAKFDTVRLK